MIISLVLPWCSDAAGAVSAVVPGHGVCDPYTNMDSFPEHAAPRRRFHLMSFTSCLPKDLPRPHHHEGRSPAAVGLCSPHPAASRGDP